MLKFSLQSTHSLANAFADFFTNKILNVREELQLEKNSVDNQFPEPPPYHGTMFCEFEPVTTNELSELKLLELQVVSPVPLIQFLQRS